MSVGLDRLADKLGFSLLPVSEAIQRDYWFLAMLITIAGSIVTVQQFRRAERDYDLRWTAGNVAAIVILVAPFAAARYQPESPAWFSTVAILAYLLLAGAIGMLVGGGVSAAAKVLAGPPDA